MRSMLAALARRRAAPRRARAPSGGSALARLGGVLILIAPIVALAQAPSPELKLSVAVAPAFPLGAAAKAWSEAMAAAPDGAVASKLHPGASLAQRDPGRELLALRDGGADLAVGSALAWSAQLPALAIYALPWLAPEPADLDALVAAPEVAGELMKRAEAQGVVILALAPLGHRALATTGKVVRAPRDLEGLRVRATGGPLVVETLAQLGARPETMSFAMAQDALARGALDAQDGLATSFVAARLPATGYRQLLLWNAFGDAMVFAVRRAVWDGFTDAQRRVALDAARRVASGAKTSTREDEAAQVLLSLGMGETRLTRAGHEAFAAAAARVREARAAAIGADLVAAAERVVAAARASRP